MGPPLVIITSLCLDEHVSEEDSKITVLASQQKNDSSQVSQEMWCIQTPVIHGRFTGTGDLCAALILGWTAKEPDNLKGVMEKVISTMFSVIQSTHERISSLETNVTNEDDSFDYNAEHRELCLIQSKTIIENPGILFEAFEVK
jgi:pyridoxine kinase